MLGLIIITTTLDGLNIELKHDEFLLLQVAIYNIVLEN